MKILLCMMMVMAIIVMPMTEAAAVPAGIACYWSVFDGWSRPGAVTSCFAFQDYQWDGDDGDWLTRLTPAIAPTCTTSIDNPATHETATVSTSTTCLQHYPVNRMRDAAGLSMDSQSFCLDSTAASACTAMSATDTFHLTSAKDISYLRS